MNNEHITEEEKAGLICRKQNIDGKIYYNYYKLVLDNFGYVQYSIIKFSCNEEFKKVAIPRCLI